MKIEAGKSYRNGKGEKIDISLDHYPFIDQNGRNYRVHGASGSVASELDLISEWVDPVTIECELGFYNGMTIVKNATENLKQFIGKKTKVTIEVIE